VRSFQSLMNDLLAAEVLHESEARLFLRGLVNYDLTMPSRFAWTLETDSIQRRSIHRSMSIPIIFG
jgi:hypothetical protein